MQYARTEGPVLEVCRSRRPVALEGEALAGHPGLADDPQAATMGSLLAVPLLAQRVGSGVPTLYGGGPVRVATLSALRQVMPFVEAAQSLIQDAYVREQLRRTQEQLRAALTSRAVIDQAKGMIMLVLKCDADQAFSHLVRMSSDRHRHVRDVARGIVDGVAANEAALLGYNSSE